MLANPAKSSVRKPDRCSRAEAWIGVLSFRLRIGEKRLDAQLACRGGLAVGPGRARFACVARDASAKSAVARVPRATRAHSGAALQHARSTGVAAKPCGAIEVVRARSIARPEVALIGRTDTARAGAARAKPAGRRGDAGFARATVCIGETLATPRARRGRVGACVARGVPEGGVVRRRVLRGRVARVGGYGAVARATGVARGRRARVVVRAGGRRGGATRHDDEEGSEDRKLPHGMHGSVDVQAPAQPTISSRALTAASHSSSRIP